MQEDLLILRDLIFEEHPDMDSSSKEFAQKLLGKPTTVKHNIDTMILPFKIVVGGEK